MFAKDLVPSLEMNLLPALREIHHFFLFLIIQRIFEELEICLGGLLSANPKQWEKRFDLPNLCEFAPPRLKQ